MYHFLLSGCNGKMGRVVTRIVREQPDCDIIAGFDVNGDPAEYPVYARPLDFPGTADALIDFSNHAYLPALLELARQRRIPAVIATTGLSQADDQLIAQASC